MALCQGPALKFHVVEKPTVYQGQAEETRANTQLIVTALAELQLVVPCTNEGLVMPKHMIYFFEEVDTWLSV